MTKKLNKDTTNSQNVVQWLSNNEVTAEVGNALASYMLNPVVTWAKFILTDDLPNGNNMRIPEEEFENLIKTGVHMPIKVAEGSIKEGHEESKPIGVITHIKKEVVDGVNRLTALAALWGTERPADVELLKSIMDENGELNVSWEISFGKRSIEEGGISALRDVILKAATIVSRPAYKGRTRFLALSAEAIPWSPAFIEELPDSSFLYIQDGGDLDSEGKTYPRELRKFAVKDATGLVDPTRLQTAKEELEQIEINTEAKEGVLSAINGMLSDLEDGKSAYFVSFGEEQSENIDTEDTLETLEQLKSELEAKSNELSTALASLNEKTDALTAVSEELNTLKTEQEVLNGELTELREFKSGIEDAEKKEAKLLAIKEKFIQANVEKDEEYFNTNAETLLKLSDEDLEFMIQEFSAFSKEAAEASLNGKLPNFRTNAGGKLSVKELAKALKERKAH